MKIRITELGWSGWWLLQKDTGDRSWTLIDIFHNRAEARLALGELVKLARTERD